MDWFTSEGTLKLILFQPWGEWENTSNLKTHLSIPGFALPRNLGWKHLCTPQISCANVGFFLCLCSFRSKDREQQVGSVHPTKGKAGKDGETQSCSFVIILKNTCRYFLALYHTLLCCFYGEQSSKSLSRLCASAAAILEQVNDDCVCATAATRAVFVWVLGKSLFILWREQTSLQMDPANLSAFYFLVSFLVVMPAVFQESFLRPWAHLWISLCLSYAEMLNFYNCSAFSCWHQVHMWMYLMLLEKESGLRGFEIQKLGCKMILESVNNTEMESTSTGSVYFLFFFLLSRVTGQLMWCTLCFNVGWCFFIDEIVNF